MKFDELKNREAEWAKLFLPGGTFLIMKVLGPDYDFQYRFASDPGNGFADQILKICPYLAPSQSLKRVEISRQPELVIPTLDEPIGHLVYRVHEPLFLRKLPLTRLLMEGLWKDRSRVEAVMPEALSLFLNHNLFWLHLTFLELVAAGLLDTAERLDPLFRRMRYGHYVLGLRYIQSGGCEIIGTCKPE
jgi:hypothetical protein